MTILQFQELYFIANSEDADLDKSIKMVGVVTGKTPEVVERMNMHRFNRICANVQRHFEIFNKNLLKGKPVKAIRVNGHWYRLHYNVARLPVNAGKYVEALTFSKNIIDNLHKIMATIAEPIKWSWRKMAFVPVKREHEDIASDMEKADFEVAYRSAVFFYTLYRVSMQITQPYLVKELMRKGANKQTANQTIADFLQITDGFTMPKWSLNLKLYLLNRFGA